jgi:pilus assembly protein CpaF
LNGFGPINPLLLDEEVSEAKVNGPNQVFAERKGKLVLTDITFRDDEHVMNIIEKIVSPLGRRIDEAVQLWMRVYLMGPVSMRLFHR